MSRVLAPVIGITFLVQLVAFFIGLGNNVILSRWLGPEMLGVFASVIVIIELVFKIVNPGLDTAAIYFISSKRFEFYKYVNTYSVNGFVVFLLGTLVLFFIPQAGFFIELFDSRNSGIISSNFFAVGFYFLSFLFHEFGVKIPLGLQQFKSYNKIQILKPVFLFLLLTGFSAFYEADLNIILVLVGASFFLPAIFYWLKALPLKFKWEKETAGESLRYGIKVMPGSIIQFLNYRADILIIGYFLTQTEVGWYYVAVLVAERLLFLTQATATILLPAASSSERQMEKTPLLSRLNFTVVLAGSILIGIIAYWIIPFLFSANYSNSVLPLVLILPGIISLSVSKLISADLAARGLPQYSTYVSILNFILNITLNLILVPSLGISGAAISSSLSYSAALILQAYYYKKISSIPLKDMLLIKKNDIKKLKFV